MINFSGNHSIDNHLQSSSGQLQQGTTWMLTMINTNLNLVKTITAMVEELYVKS